MAAAVVLFVGCQPVPVRSFGDIGPVRRPTSVVAQDIGASVRIAGTETWVFGDAILDRPACDGRRLRTSTAAIGGLTAITEVTEPLDACGAPAELFQYRPDEPFVDHCSRTSLWPESIVAAPSGQAGIIYYTKGRIEACGTYPRHEGVGVATIEAGATSATREDGVVFGPGEPIFTYASTVDDGFVYVFAEVKLDTFVRRYKLARVARTASPADRSAYRFWDGRTWTADVAGAAFVDLRGSGNDANAGIAGVTISWNPYLRRYLMVQTDYLRHDVLLRTSERPQGPWSAPTHLDVADSVAPAFNYAAYEHPAYRSSDGRTIYLTYHRTTGWARGEVRMVRVVLA